MSEIGDPYVAPPVPGSYLAAIKRKPRKLRIAFATKHGHRVEEGMPPVPVGDLSANFPPIASTVFGNGSCGTSRTRKAGLFRESRSDEPRRYGSESETKCFVIGLLTRNQPPEYHYDFSGFLRVLFQLS
jgi:hypothetical protein